MKRVSPHVRLFTQAMVSNIWLLQDSAGRRFLIDTGYTLERPALRLGLWSAGVRRQGDLTAVLLTHRHLDHAANADWVRGAFGCPVYCHRDESPFLLGEKIPAPMLPRAETFHQRLLCRIEDRRPARAVIDGVFDGGPWRWDFEILHVPGHTEGSAMIFHRPTQTLFSGDAILTARFPPLRSFERVHPAVAGFCLDVAACRARVREHVRTLDSVRTLCSGHGPAVTEDASSKLRVLLG